MGKMITDFSTIKKRVGSKQIFLAKGLAFKGNIVLYDLGEYVLAANKKIENPLMQTILGACKSLEDFQSRISRTDAHIIAFYEP